MNTKIERLKSSPFTPAIGGLAVGALSAWLLQPRVRGAIGTRVGSLSSTLRSSDLITKVSSQFSSGWSGIVDYARDLGSNLVSTLSNPGGARSDTSPSGVSRNPNASPTEHLNLNRGSNHIH